MERTRPRRSYWIPDLLLFLDLLTGRVTILVERRWTWLPRISAAIAKESLVSWGEVAD